MIPYRSIAMTRIDYLAKTRPLRHQPREAVDEAIAQTKQIPSE